MILIDLYTIFILAHLTVKDALTYQLPNQNLCYLLPSIAAVLVNSFLSTEFFSALSILCNHTLAAVFIMHLLHLLKMSGGDCKLAALGGLLVGFTSILYSLLLGLSTSLLYVFFRWLFYRTSYHEPFPLGPFINLGILIQLCM